VEENGWFKILRDVQDKFGRAAAPHVMESQKNETKGGHRRYEPFLFASAFTHWTDIGDDPQRPDGGGDRGPGFVHVQLFAADIGCAATGVRDAVAAALRELSPDGTFTRLPNWSRFGPAAQQDVSVSGDFMLQQILTGRPGARRC